MSAVKLPTLNLHRDGYSHVYSCMFFLTEIAWPFEGRVVSPSGLSGRRAGASWAYFARRIGLAGDDLPWGRPWDRTGE